MNEGVIWLYGMGIVIIASLYLAITSEKSEDSRGLKFIGWLTGLGICYSIVFAILSSTLSGDEYYTEKHYLYPISMVDGNRLSSDFFLGSGTIENVDYYFFYYESTYGLKRSKIEAYNAYIIETDSRTPEIVEVIEEFEDRFGIEFLPAGRVRYKLYLPKGTIIRNFSLK